MGCSLHDGLAQASQVALLFFMRQQLMAIMLLSMHDIDPLHPWRQGAQLSLTYKSGSHSTLHHPSQEWTLLLAAAALVACALNHALPCGTADL